MIFREYHSVPQNIVPFLDACCYNFFEDWLLGDVASAAMLTD